MLSFQIAKYAVDSQRWDIWVSKIINIFLGMYLRVTLVSTKRLIFCCSKVTSFCQHFLKNVQTMIVIDLKVNN